MKRIILLISPLALIWACTPQNREDNIVLVERYVDAVVSNDFATMDSLLADNYMGYGPGINDSTNKKDGIANWQENSEELYSSISFERTQYVATTVTEGQAAGDWVTTWAHVNLSYKDGRGPVNFRANSVYRIEKGKIAFSISFYDASDILRQLGYQFIPPSGQ